MEYLIWEIRITIFYSETVFIVQIYAESEMKDCQKRFKFLEPCGSKKRDFFDESGNKI